MTQGNGIVPAHPYPRNESFASALTALSLEAVARAEIAREIARCPVDCITACACVALALMGVLLSSPACEACAITCGICRRVCRRVHVFACLTPACPCPFVR